MKKGPGLLISISLVSMLCFLGIVVWVNWEKPRIQSETLSTELKKLISHVPGRSDALIYIGMKDIRNSAFWQKVMPDSIKQAPIISMGKTLDSLSLSRGIVMSEDIDTLFISFRQTGYKKNDFLGVASGKIIDKIPETFLKTKSLESISTKNATIYKLEKNFWLTRLGSKRIAVANNREMLEGFIQPSGSFFERDSLAAALIDKAVYKSHLWFALPSAEWTNGALQSLTSANSDMKGLGNLNRIMHLALSARFNEGIEAETEWVYKTRRAAFFASTFLWGAVKLTGLSESRTSPQTRELLRRVHIEQNLESVIIKTDLPETIFRKSINQP
ncbi:MAG: hypothetical protein JW989_03155 [Chlorobiaceae bacterium]|nr:hypothetical protein [Chlorobiaceae bacterium]